MLVSRTLDDTMSARATVDDRPVARLVAISDAASLFVERTVSHSPGNREDHEIKELSKGLTAKPPHVSKRIECSSGATRHKVNASSLEALRKRL
jgi:antitoxin (DNA-binding transcriptional repressor) of toxin-antitoxin stability system